MKLLTFFSFALSALSSAFAGPLNIMVFLLDDMGVMDTSVPFLTDESGEPKRYPLNDFYRTPSMERLAEQGIRLNNFCAMSVCSPSRISIMTGQNAARHRTTNWIAPASNNKGEQGPPAWNWKGLKKGEVTLPGVLKGEGYRTIHVGKAHLGPRGSEGSDPLNLGFEVNVGGGSMGQPGSYYGEKSFGGGPDRSVNAVPHLEKYHGRKIFLTEALTLEAKREVTRSVAEKKPFFLQFAHYAVHTPFQSDPRFAANYETSGKPKSARAFATLIEGMDKSLGDMLDCFEELGIAEDTLVLFLGDNGTDAPLGPQYVVACAEPLRGKKGAHYEGGMRVPFIAAWAKPNPANEWQRKLVIPQGVIQPQLAAVQDLFPTLLSLAGVEVPAGHVVDGHPLQTLLTGKSDPERPEQFLMHYPHGPHRSSYFTTWRDGDWKVIYHAVPGTRSSGNRLQFEGGHYELFNLKNDPFEQENLAQKEPAILKRMMTGLVEQLEKHEALYPVDAEGNPLKPEIP